MQFNLETDNNSVFQCLIAGIKSLYFLKLYKQNLNMVSMADPHLQIRGAGGDGHSDPEIRGNGL